MDEDDIPESAPLLGLRALQELAKGGNMAPKAAVYGPGHGPGGSVIMNTQAHATAVRQRVKAEPVSVASIALDDIVLHTITRLARLTRVQGDPSDFTTDVQITEDSVTVKLTAKNRYGRLILSEVKEQYTEEELKKG